MVAPLLECRGVSAGFDGGGELRVVLRGVSLKIDRGDAIVIVGASGSGKSTLLRLLNRFDDPLEGEVLLDGRPMARADPLSVRRRIALVPQAPVMFETTVRDNFQLRPVGSPRPSERAMTRLLDAVSLDGAFLDRNADELSVGEKQRVAIARSLLAEPDAILLDEPTSALDPKATTMVGRMLARLRSSHELTIVLVTHQRDLLRVVEGRRVLIRDGTVRPDVPDEAVDELLVAP